MTRYARASLARRLGRSWDASLTFEYNRRDADAGDDYTERRYILSLAWAPVRRVIWRLEIDLSRRQVSSEVEPRSMTK